jgi:hypothetical protein
MAELNRDPNTMTVAQLRQALSSAGISAPSRLRRPDLIALYERHLQSRAPSVPAPRPPLVSPAPPAPVAPPAGARRSRRAPPTQEAPTTTTPRSRVRYGEEGLAGMTKSQLQEELRRRGLPTGGTREALLERLNGPQNPPVSSAQPSLAPRQAAAPTAAAPTATTPSRRRGRPSALAAPSPAARSPAASTVVPARGEIPFVPLSLPPPPTPVVPGPMPSVTLPITGSSRTSSSVTTATTGFPLSRSRGTTSPRPSGTTSPRLNGSRNASASTETTSPSGTTLSPRLSQRAPGTLSPLRGAVGPVAGQGTANGRQRL